MKQRLILMGVLLCFSMLIAPVSAIADIAIPNTFVSGTPALASEVNANFQAVNTRQVAIFATMAGTYTLQTTKLTTASSICASLINGTITLTSIGEVSATTSKTILGAVDCGSGSSGTITGTYTVNADGSGVITFSGFVLNFKASKDLNTLLLRGTSDGIEQGAAIRN